MAKRAFEIGVVWIEGSGWGRGAVERLTAVPGERKANLQVTRSTTIDVGGRDASYVGHNTAKKQAQH
jgi:hypothetical protein